MKKRVLFLSFLLFLASCGGNEVSSNMVSDSSQKVNDSTTSSSSFSDTSSSLTSSESSISSSSSSSSGSSSSSIQLKDFTNVSFESVSCSYDGASHILHEVVGAPDGTDVVYSNRKSYVDAGSYSCTAILTKDGYNSKTLTATLTILPIDFEGITYENKTVTYDGTDHFSDIQLTGILPPDTTYEQKVLDSTNTLVTSTVDVGTYSYSVTLKNKNYHDMTLTATLTIKQEKTDMPIFVADDGTVYFANGLDGRPLYSLSGTTLKKIDYSAVKEFNRCSSTSVIYLGDSLFLDSAKELTASASSVLYTDTMMADFVKKDENIYYYSKNSLSQDKAGIYKVDVTDRNQEPVVQKVFSGKTDNLSIYNNYLYFENGADNDYLYRMNLATGTAECVLQNKIHEYVLKGNKIYCVLNNALNDYIGYVDLADSDHKVNKITDSAGEFLTLKGNYLYYNYSDLYGAIDESKKGVYKIDLSDNTETQVLQINSINGLGVESDGSILYNDGLDAKLYRYNVSTKAKINLLDGFVAPEMTPLNTGGRTLKYNDKIYFLNMYDEKCLYVYDEKTKVFTKASENKVADFYIYGDTLYFNTVTLLTNNDLYSVNLKQGGEATRISSNDIRNMVCDGTYLYGTHYDFLGLAGGLARMKLDGSEYVKFSEINGGKNLAIKDDRLYFINCTTGQDNGDIQYYTLSDIQSTSDDLKANDFGNDKIKNVRQFIFEGDYIYYIYQGLVNNFIARGKESEKSAGTKLASSSCAPKEMILVGDDIYYYSYPQTSPSSAGLYKVSKNATSADTTKSLILSCNTTYYCSALCYSDNGIYFLNYCYLTNLPYGDAHFYRVDLSDNTCTRMK